MWEGGGQPEFELNINFKLNWHNSFSSRLPVSLQLSLTPPINLRNLDNNHLHQWQALLGELESVDQILTLAPFLTTPRPCPSVMEEHVIDDDEDEDEEQESDWGTEIRNWGLEREHQSIKETLLLWNWRTTLSESDDNGSVGAFEFWKGSSRLQTKES